MPLDTRIALSGQPLQVQFRDPIANYNQLAQLRSSDTQNQLAQMQMQEARQLAPLRLQEQQSRAKSTQLTLDQATEAQNFIKSVMAKAAEHPDAPKDPMIAARLMLADPREEVSSVGKRLFESAAIIQEYEDNQRYRASEDGAPAAAPAAASAAPAAPNFVTGVDSFGKTRYAIDAAKVSKEEFDAAKNQLASNVQMGAPRSEQLAANALVQPQTAPTTTANDVYAKIKAGDREFNNAKGWLKNRELLVAQYKEALKPGKTDNLIGNVNPSDFTPESVATFKLSGNYADLVLKPEKAEADRAPPSVGGDAERISQKLYGKRFSQLTQAEAAIVDAEVEKRDLAGKKASAPSTVTNVNAFTPASVTAQQDFIKSATDERKALRNAPDTLKNIDAAKKLIPTASTFMGTGGEPLLAAASFLNNRLGFSIATKGVTDATVLRTRLFEGILDNLKKLDSQPSQEQQRVLSEALGNLGTDPAALEQILDRIGETVRDRVDRYNADVNDAQNNGVKFPFTPQIAMPAKKPKPTDAAAQIPTGKPASNIDALLNKYK